jgi:hypothetical protein
MVECCHTVSFMLTVAYAECRKLALYAECHYAQCPYAEYMLTFGTPLYG